MQCDTESNNSLANAEVTSPATSRNIVAVDQEVAALLQEEVTGMDAGALEDIQNVQNNAYIGNSSEQTALSSVSTYIMIYDNTINSVLFSGYQS